MKVKQNESEIEGEQMNNRVRRQANTQKEESSCGIVERENTEIKENVEGQRMKERSSTEGKSVQCRRVDLDLKLYSLSL